uniref:MOG interacting and ectopic P-granules protein 1 n=1 Tax=Anopheles coluzzii TaxID=1518534 RepID=A0A8W7PXS3_ANOCL
MDNGTMGYGKGTDRKVKEQELSITVAEEDNDDGEELHEEADKNGTNSEAANGEKSATEPQANSDVAPSGEEKLHSNAADRLVKKEAAEPTESSSDATDPSSRSGEGDATEPSKHATEEKKLSTSRESDEIETMDVDEEEEDGDVVAVDAENGTANGSAGGDEEPPVVAAKQPQQQVTEVDDDEPMEVDGGDEQDAAAAAPTNGHKESNADEDGATVRSEKLTSSKTAAEKDKTEPPTHPASKQPADDNAEEEEEDDDKPVSINSDSEGEESPQKRDSGEPVAAADKATKPATNSKLILVDEGGLAKLNEAVPAAAAATVAGGVASAGKKSDTVPSNGVVVDGAAATATRTQNGDCDGDLTILSDKEDDCVVIEDDDGESDASVPTVPANNARRSGSIRATGGRKSDGGVGGGAASLMTGSAINPLAAAAAALQQQQLNQSIVSSMDDDDEDEDDDDDDIEEIIDDPLALGTQATNLSMGGRGYQPNTPVNLKGQKSLLMNNAAGGAAGGKEPTLVIIDTNTMMNNGGGAQRGATNLASAGVTSPNVNSNAANLLAKASSAGILANASASPGAQFNSRSLLNSPGVVGNSPVAAAAGAAMLNQGGMLGKNAAAGSALAPVTPLLPALTDDMFVLEAPSFIVPYIYEKPPADNLRDIVDELEVTIKEMRKNLEESGAVPPAASKHQGGDTAEQAKEDGAKNALETSTDDEASDEEQKTKVLIKEARADIEAIKEHIISPSDKDDLTGVGSGGGSSGGANGSDPKKSENYFENPLGKFFMNIGINLVQEFVQTDLLRQQKRKRDREGKPSPSTQLAINSLMKNLEQSKENNKPYKFEMKRCEYCPFKSESALVMAHHYETPHMRNFIYKCNFCAYETRPPHDILYHMEAVHNIKGRMEKALSYHHCPNCPFEDNGKSKLARHAVACAKKFRPELNLNPPMDWEPPAKIPRIKPKHGLVGTATAYQVRRVDEYEECNDLEEKDGGVGGLGAGGGVGGAGGGRAPAIIPSPTGITGAGSGVRGAGAVAGLGGGLNATALAASAAAIRNTLAGAGMVIPNNLQLSASALAAAAAAGGFSKYLPNASSMKATKTAQAPSISITPLPRQSASNSSSAAANMSNIAGALSKLQAQGTSAVKPGQNPSGGKMAFVVCEICDGYIKDLDQLRNHMQWIHKVKIHPKMIYNRPPLNCQKCQYRFFTDQGLERHLLGSHGLVTSSMQEAANKGKDAGRCPVCGRVYQWKLLNHVSRDHNMTLKPAHLSYKCTVCTATFGMYKQFESHVYSAHSTVAKKTGEGKGSKGGGGGGGGGMGQQQTSSGMGGSGGSSSSGGAGGLRNPFVGGGDSLLKPLKINDEITIIPQPTSNSKMAKTIELESHVID